MLLGGLSIHPEVLCHHRATLLVVKTVTCRDDWQLNRRIGHGTTAGERTTTARCSLDTHGSNVADGLHRLNQGNDRQPDKPRSEETTAVTVSIVPLGIAVTVGSNTTAPAATTGVTPVTNGTKSRTVTVAVCPLNSMTFGADNVFDR